MTQPKPLDYQEMTNQAFVIRDEFAAAASKLDESQVTMTSGGVTVTLTLSGTMRAVKIDPRAATDIASVERDVKLAYEAAASEIRRQAEEMLSPLRDLVAQATQAYTGP